MKKLHKNTARAVVRRAVVLHRFLPGDCVCVGYKFCEYFVTWISASQIYLVKRRSDGAWNLVNDGMF